MKYSKLTPNLIVEDVSRSLSFYTEKLGFTRFMTVPEAEPFIFAGVVKDGVEIFLNQKQMMVSLKPEIAREKSGGWMSTMYIETENVDALCAEFEAKGVKIVEPLKTQFYGMREFIIVDPDGWLIIFASKA